MSAKTTTLEELLTSPRPSYRVDRRPPRVTRCADVGTLQCDHGEWLDPVIDSLDQLLGLEDGWDSYSASRIDAGTAEAVVDLLGEIMLPGTPVPALVPLRSGGIQIEWHERGVDLEIQVRSQTDVRASYDNLGDGDGWDDKKLGANIGPLRGPIRKLSAY